MLDFAKLIANAEQATGHSDWGEPEFRNGLVRLCASTGADDALAGQISAQLEKRLYLYADRTAHPEIPAQEIIAPVFVVGFPRSGTTILHALLAADPRARSPLAWEIGAPSPPPRAETALNDPRIAATQAGIEQLPQQFRAMHAMGATLPDEDNSIMQLAFRSLNFAATREMPDYVDWLLECDMAPAFALHRHMLQHLQAFHKRDWWVLKAPPHLFALDALFATYPDARIIFTHRDPASIMPSNASLIAFLHEMSGNAVDRAALGKAEAAKWRKGMERAMAFRAQSPQLSDRFFDLQYRDFTTDPMAAVEAVYHWLNIALPAEPRAAMTAFLADSRQGKHGKHDYTPEQFGMSAEAIRAGFSAYMDVYTVPMEGTRP
jgi:Sulfotransferase family